MSIKKQSLKSKPLCKVSFKLSKEQALNADVVAICGDFNNWNTEVNTMNRLKDGSFSQTIELPAGAEYQFRYLADGCIWFDEPEAERMQLNAFNSAMNNVITT